MFPRNVRIHKMQDVCQHLNHYEDNEDSITFRSTHEKKNALLYKYLSKVKRFANMT